MDINYYTVKSKRNCNPEVQEKLMEMISLLDNELKLWLDRTQGKTVNMIIKCESALKCAEYFASEDDWKAFILTMQGNINIESLKACFYQNKDKQNEMMKLYKSSLNLIIKWIDSKEREKPI